MVSPQRGQKANRTDLDPSGPSSDPVPFKFWPTAQIADTTSFKTEPVPVIAFPGPPFCQRYRAGLLRWLKRQLRLEYQVRLLDLPLDGRLVFPQGKQPGSLFPGSFLTAVSCRATTSRKRGYWGLQSSCYQSRHSFPGQLFADDRGARWNALGDSPPCRRHGHRQLFDGGIEQGYFAS